MAERPSIIGEILELPPEDTPLSQVQRAWAFLDGADVCPDCQSLTERHDIIRRIVGAIEQEVARTTEGRLDPSTPEAILIEFAMELRQEGIPPPPPPPISVLRPVRGTDEEPSRLSVTVTGAFLTGCPLKISIAEYDRVQQSLARELARVPGQGWSVNTDHWRHEGTYYSGGGFASMLPLVIARRIGADALERLVELLEARPLSELTWLATKAAGWVIEPQSIRIDIYDLGMAVVAGTFAVEPVQGADLSIVAPLFKELVWLKPDHTGTTSPLVGAFRALAEQTTRQFQDAARRAAPDLLQRPWLSPFVEALAPDQATDLYSSPDWGRLLWLHPVHLLQLAEDEGLRTAANHLAPPFHRSVDVPDGCFVPGIGWSAIVSDRLPISAEVPLRILELHWAYIALYMEMDRGLLVMLEGGRWQGSEALTDLEGAADQVFGDYIRLVEARARVDSHFAGLGGDEQALWDVITDVTKLDALIDGVDRKVSILQQMAERKVQQAAAAQARRTTAILSFLTALTLVTVAVALLTNFVGSRSDTLGHLSLRITIVALALVTSIGLYREAFREGPRRRRTRRP